ncbi:MAG TPA: histidine kinase [Candidatus Paenibacillus intestinavium]|nr:histidine kinase [Candidatus Paenibacillus intestinavium]
MNKLKKYMVPDQLKYRLFLTFFVLIIIPFSIMNIVNFRNIEALIQQKINEQSRNQLQNIYNLLQDQMSIAFKVQLYFEQDATIQQIVQFPEKGTILSNKAAMEERFKSMNNSFFLYNPFVYYTILDFSGNVYTSYAPKRALNYKELLQDTNFQRVQEERLRYLWITDDPNDISRDLSSSNYLLSLYSIMEKSQMAFGLSRVSIDYGHWFQTTLRDQMDEQDYFMIMSNGDTIAGSRKGDIISEEVTSMIIASDESGYFTDKNSNSFINYMYMDTLDGYIVNRVSLTILFSEINELKKQYYFLFFILIIAFSGITFLVVHTFLRPLNQLQRKMRDVVRNRFQQRLYEKSFKGEILDLATTFNKMLDDLDVMVVKLKEEEKQRDVLHFQMLLTQLNPHFLLNTLNTMKWIALRNGQEEISTISMSLGKLLESGLNSEIDLIHLKEEIELVNAYLYIQNFRYNNKFRIEYFYDKSLEYALLPKLSLQPLVENAIQHGIGDMDTGGFIHIRIFQKEQLLIIEVEDNGSGIDLQKSIKPRMRPGIGLNNIKERLRLLFKEQGQLEIVTPQQGTIIKIILPFLMSAPFESNKLHDKE